MNKPAAECMRNEKGTSGQISIAADLTTLSYRYCLIWTSTRDQILRKCNYPRKYRYGLQLDVKQKPAHLLLLILLAGDVATNPGPPKSGRNFVNCLVINACSLKSRHFVNGRKLCHLSSFQDLVYSEQPDFVWVTETWLTDDVHNCEILNNSYYVYRKDWETRQGGGVMLAVKASSFISSKEIEDINVNIEVMSCEITTNSNLKYAICCCYRPPNVGTSWLEEFNSFLVQLTSRYRNILICGDFNFPKINWHEDASVTSSNETEFVEELNDFYFTQVNKTPYSPEENTYWTSSSVMLQSRSSTCQR